MHENDYVIRKSNLEKKYQNNGYYLLLIYRIGIHFITSYFCF